MCFHCHSLNCLDFSVNNLYFIIFKIEKKVILLIGGGVTGGGIGGSGGGFGGASKF